MVFSYYLNYFFDEMYIQLSTHKENYLYLYPCRCYTFLFVSFHSVVSVV
jgi:hypothetical protein